MEQQPSSPSAPTPPRQSAAPLPSGQPKFPPPPNFPAPAGVGGPMVRSPGGLKPLVLPRRISPLQRAQEATQATAEARRSIDAIFSLSRTPWTAGETRLSSSQVEELQKTIRQLEAKLAERELALTDAEAKLGDRERVLAETEALLKARAQVIAASEQPGGGGMSKEQEEALKKLKEELDRQEQSIKEQRAALAEREEFLNQSEASLFEKMQAQQEKETELEQKEEDIKRLARQAGVLKEEPPEPMEKA